MAKSKNPSAGARRRARRREEALKSYEATPQTKKSRGKLLGTLSVIVLGGAAAGAAFIPDLTPDIDTTPANAELPAAPAHFVCAPAPKLPEAGDAETDVGFSPVSTDAHTGLNLAVLSDLAGTIPGITTRDATPDQDTEPETTKVTDSNDEETQQGPAASASKDGSTRVQSFTETIAKPGGSAGAPVIATTEPLGGRIPLFSAVTEFSADDGDLAGLAAAQCAPAAHQQWISGITTTSGTTSVLTLTNPAASPSSVDLSFFGADGPIDAAGTSGLVIGPNQTRSFVVGGLAPDEEAVAARINASGGAVAASVQQHTLDGLTPQGVELLEPTASPSTTVHIPGIQVSHDDLAPEVFITATGSGSDVEIQVLGEDGPVPFDGDSALSLDGSSTVAVPLEGLKKGTYSVTVTSQTPIVASAVSTSGTPGKETDMAHMPGARSLELDQMVALPDATARLVFTADREANVTITPVDKNGKLGEAKDYSIAADTSVDIKPPAGESLRIETDSRGVYLGQFLTNDDGISATAVLPARTAESGLPVRVNFGS